MNVLVLTGRYLPKMSANSVCIDNVIRCMPETVESVTCVCYDDGFSYTDQRVDIIRISRGIVKSILYQLEDNRSFIGRIIKKILLALNNAELLLRIPFWPWLDPIFTAREFNVAKKIVEKKKIDIVIAVHMPLSSIIVGAKLKKIYPKLRFYPYFLDSLSGGIPFALMPAKWNLKKKLKWEKSLLPYADKIIVMNSSRLHHEKYSKKFEYYNRFVYLDIPLLKHPEMVNVRNPFDVDYMNVVFCGTANMPLRNMEYFSEISKKLEKTKIRFTIIGQCNCVELFDADNVHYIPAMSHNQLRPYLQYADAFINFGVRTPAAISGKIFEYMSYGKPIISTYSIDDEACIPYLRKYPASLLIDERNSDIDRAADMLLRFVCDWKGRMVGYNEVCALFQDNRPETFVEKILT